MTDLAFLAAPLLRATARARSLKESTLVIKLGGSAMEDPAATAGTLDCIAALQQLNVKTIIVHGGGKPIDRAMATSGLLPKKVLGRRYTDDATLEIVVRVLNEINSQLIADLKERGLWANCHADLEAVVLDAFDDEGQIVDLGHVGVPHDIEDVDWLMNDLWVRIIPVVPSYGKSPTGTYLNINADTAASFIAGKIKADAVYFLTDTVGVLANRADPSSLYPRLTVADCKKLIADGVIEGGMIPKVEACFEALAVGAKRAVILDGRNPYSLLSEFVSDTVMGTEIVP